jgi:aspartate kinase
MKKIIIMKFGGASLVDPAQFHQIAEIIAQKKHHYDQIGIVVSAMGNTTDQLLALAHQIHPSPPKRELDMLISTGERVSMALLAMALSLKGIEALSFTGSQSGIITSSHHSNANILDVRPFRLIPHLEQGKVVIVAGFQGVSRKGEITTLGRGGSDTTAVGLAIALRAEKVEFYKDVEGFYSEDPKKNPEAVLFSRISYSDALDLVQRQNARILHPRALFLAQKNRVPLHVLSFKKNKESFGTLIEEPFSESLFLGYEEDG